MSKSSEASDVEEIYEAEAKYSVGVCNCMKNPGVFGGWIGSGYGVTRWYH